MSGRAGSVSGPQGSDRGAEYRGQPPSVGKLSAHRVEVRSPTYENVRTIHHTFHQATTGQTDRLRGTGGTPKPQPFVDQRASTVIQDTLATYMVMKPQVLINEPIYELISSEEPLPPIPGQTALRPNRLYEASPPAQSSSLYELEGPEDDEPLPPLPTSAGKVPLTNNPLYEGGLPTSSAYELEEPLPPLPTTAGKVPLTNNPLYEGGLPTSSLYELEEPLPNPLHGRSSVTSSDPSSHYELEAPLSSSPYDSSLTSPSPSNRGSSIYELDAPLSSSPYDSSLTSPSPSNRGSSIYELDAPLSSSPSSSSERSSSSSPNYVAYTPPPTLTATFKGHYVAYTPPPSVLRQPEYVAMRPGYQSATGEKGKPNPAFKELKQTSGFEIAARSGQLQTIKPFSTKIEHQGKELALTGLASGNGGKRGAEFVQAQFSNYLTEALATVPLTQESFSTAVKAASKRLEGDMVGQGISESTSLSIALTTEKEVFTAEVGGGAIWVKDQGGTYLLPKGDDVPIPNRPRNPAIMVKEVRAGDDRTTRTWTEEGRKYTVMSLTSRRRDSIQMIQQRFYEENGQTSEVYCEVFKSKNNGRSWEKAPIASDIGNPTTPIRVQTAVLPRTPNMELYVLSPEMAQAAQAPDFLKGGQGASPHRQASDLVKQMEEKTEGPLGLVAIRLG